MMSKSIANAVLLEQSPPSGKRAHLKLAQRACYDVLSLAVEEGQVFAALTGPSGCGKTTILEAVLAGLRGPSLRCIRVREPHKVSPQLALEIEQAAYSEARKPENMGRHVLLVVDDAHDGSAELLRCITRIAEMREPGRRVPQILLVGGLKLWERLTDEEFQPLARSLAIRTALPAAEDDDDLWTSVEQGMAQTRKAPRSDSMRLISEPAPVPLGPATQRHGRLRLLVPFGLLLVSAGASAYSLSFHRWSDLLNALPWTRINPSVPSSDPPSPLARPSSPSSPASATASPARPMPTQASAPATRPATPAADVAPQVSAPPPSPAASPNSEPPAKAAVPVVQPVTPAPNPAAPTDAVARPVTATSTQPIAAASTPSKSPLSPEMSALLLRRGKESLADGDISAARLLFQRAAELGSAEGARLVARTYDAAFLPALDAATFADPNKARSWYLREGQLGRADAASRSPSPTP